MKTDESGRKEPIHCCLLFRKVVDVVILVNLNGYVVIYLLLVEECNAKKSDDVHVVVVVMWMVVVGVGLVVNRCPDSIKPVSTAYKRTTCYEQWHYIKKGHTQDNSSTLFYSVLLCTRIQVRTKALVSVWMYVCMYVDSIYPYTVLPPFRRSGPG